MGDERPDRAVHSVQSGNGGVAVCTRAAVRTGDLPDPDGAASIGEAHLGRAGAVSSGARDMPPAGRTLTTTVVMPNRALVLGIGVAAFLNLQRRAVHPAAHVRHGAPIRAVALIARTDGAKMQTPGDIGAPRSGPSRRPSGAIIAAPPPPATTRKRSELEGLLDQLCRGDVLILTKHDRLARSLRDLIDIVEAIRQRGAGFRCLAEGIDKTTPAGRPVFDVFGSIAGIEWEHIVERTPDGPEAPRRRGRVGHRPRALSAEAQQQMQRMREEENGLPRSWRACSR